MSVTLEDLLEWKKSMEAEIDDLDSKIRPLTESLFKKREELKTVERLIAIRDGSRRFEPVAVASHAVPNDGSIANLSVSDAALRVLADAGTPLHYQEIVERLQTCGYQISGDNPGANLIAHMVRDNRLVRCDRGTYALRKWAESPDSSLRIMPPRRRRRHR